MSFVCQVFILFWMYNFGLSFDSLVDLHTKIEMHSQATLFSCVFQLVSQVSLVYIYSVEQYYLQYQHRNLRAIFGVSYFCQCLRYHNISLWFKFTIKGQ